MADDKDKVGEAQSLAKAKKLAGITLSSASGFENFQVRSLSRKLNEIFDAKDVWAIFPPARAILIEDEDVGLGILNIRKITDLLLEINGGTVLWDEYKHRHLSSSFLPRRVKRSLKDSKPIGKASAKLRLRSYVPVRIKWNDRSYVALVVGNTKPHLGRILSFSEGDGLRKPAEWQPESKVAVRTLLDVRQKKIEIEKRGGLELEDKSSASEGPIESDLETLPEQPPRFYEPQKRGRPRAGSESPLIPFIRAVYGPYLPRHKDTLRAYIYRHDETLYQAIQDYERQSELPDDIRMPAQREQATARFWRAAKQGLDELSSAERKSVLSKAARIEKSKLTPK